MEYQTKFAEIGAYPEKFNVGNVLSRLMDGLGFRYYWATENLNENDLEYSPGNGNRSVYDTLNHLFNMIDFAGSILEDKTHPFPEKEYTLSLHEIRYKTLNRIDKLKKLLQEAEDSDLEKLKVKVKVEENYMEFPIWHLIHGPLVDSFYHLGQVVSFRRANGNPIDSNVQPFMGKRMEA